jgi:hypothetical protein
VEERLGNFPPVGKIYPITTGKPSPEDGEAP